MANRVVRKKKKDEEMEKGKVGKITNPKFQTQEGAMRKPTGEASKTAHVLTAREIAEYKRKNKSANRKKSK